MFTPTGVPTYKNNRRIDYSNFRKFTHTHAKRECGIINLRAVCKLEKVDCFYRGFGIRMLTVSSFQVIEIAFTRDKKRTFFTTEPSTERGFSFFNYCRDYRSNFIHILPDKKSADEFIKAYRIEYLNKLLKIEPNIQYTFRSDKWVK